jgi:glycerol-3-phosphate dehydrogenase (NAD(P)+)
VTAETAVAVVGAGSWGTALAVHLARRGHRVRLWARDAGLAAAMAGARANERYLARVKLPDDVLPTADAGEALAGSEAVVIAVPSAFVAGVIGGLAGAVPRDALVVSAVKGLVPGRRLRISELLGEVLPGRRLAVLSGPSFAREVALGQPTALVAAAAAPEVARAVQQAVAGPALRVYTNADVVGVEIAGALKNVVAIASGLSDSLGLGENARAALVTRGLAEIVRLGVAMGASPRTFSGLAGLGDLVLTALGEQSRNRTLGLAIGRGQSLADVESGTRMVAEGVRTVREALALGAERAVRMPICEAVAAVLFAGTPPADALTALLSRELRDEEDGGPHPYV